MRTRLEDAFAALRSKYPPSVLDVGCGTGRVLDLGLARPERYAGVDPSGAMLNHLVRKHPSVGAVYPVLLGATVSPWFTYGQFEIVTVLMPEGQPLGDELVQELRRVGTRGVIVGDGDAVTVLEVRRRSSAADGVVSESR